MVLESLVFEKLLKVAESFSVASKLEEFTALALSLCELLSSNGHDITQKKKKIKVNILSNPKIKVSCLSIISF